MASGRHRTCASRFHVHLHSILQDVRLADDSYFGHLLRYVRRRRDALTHSLTVPPVRLGNALVDTALLPTLAYLVDVRHTSVYG